MISILVCEDEFLIAHRIVRLIEATASFPTKITTCHALEEACVLLDKEHIDLLFLDLNLHGKSGFELFKGVLAQPYHTIIISANTDRAIEAYEYGVLDFIAKPFSQERMQVALERFVNGRGDKDRKTKYLAIRSHKRTEFIEVSKINYVKAASIYSEIHLMDGAKKIYDKPLNQLLKILPDNFIRAHKSYVLPIANIQMIKHPKPNSYVALLKNGKTVPLSRNRRKEVLGLISNTL
ncbi:LytR/AlgR family response regulator transcription factor [Flagellimonas sp.]|jgi:two-component system response regulator LytT|uniref:LytR/AlgR family response regulator transcription factor n=1 Tax=Flagellimonas sp. TaxID=2058762 RepID=UPI003BA95EBC